MGPFDAVVRAGQSERAERHERLAVDRKGFAAGGEHAQPGAAGQQCRDQVGHGVDQVLAVVDQQQALPAAELVDEYVQLVALHSRPGLEHRTAPQPDPGEQGRADLGLLGHRGKVDHPGAVAILVAVAAGGLDGEPGLAARRRDRAR
ncbi:hypothetical protein ACRJ4W_14465 [Streptomyces sp. GLT-R25]